VEQDQTPHVFLHHAKLVSNPAGKLPDHRRFDRKYQNHDGAQDQGKGDTKSLSYRSRNHRCGDGHSQPETRRIPWRLNYFVLPQRPAYRTVHLCAKPYYFNGHNFIEKELGREKIGFRKNDNAFLAVSDPQALQAAADRFTSEVIRKRLEYWTLILGPMFSKSERAAMDLHPFYAVSQAEFGADRYGLNQLATTCANCRPTGC
jgi:hypothetical protein